MIIVREERIVDKQFRAKNAANIKETIIFITFERYFRWRFLNSIYLFISYFTGIHSKMARSARAVEYTDCICAVEKDSSNECPGYDT